MDEYGLHRSVHPRFIQQGMVGMEAFSPSSEENYNLSVDCERIWLGKESYRFRTVTLSKQSAGIWTVPRDFVSKLKLEVRADQQSGNPAHSLIDFPKQKVDKAKRRDAARRLADFANQAAISRIG